jgi:hypothetical protein
LNLFAMPWIAAPGKKAQPSAGSASATTKRSLAIALQTFTHPAESPEKSYSHLQSKVPRLRFELERTNRDLTISLEENADAAEFGNVCEAPPCGIAVVDKQGAFRMMNPDAQRLLEPLAPRIVMLSPAEIPPVVSVQSKGVVQ